MNTHTHLEDLSNEVFFEIFDYLHALDIFTAFASLNKRILSILQSIPFRVIILSNHYKRDIDFLSSHLTYHAHQVISLKSCDTIRDRSSIISLLFNRHHFVNLQSCIFMSINPLTELQGVIKQLQGLNKLVSFSMLQPDHRTMNVTNTCDLTQTIFMHKSSFLRSARLHYNTYDYFDISTYTSIASNLMSLDLLMSGSPDTVSVYSILPILRVCHRIRHLHAIISCESPSQNNNVK
jgi:virulence-associated protein VapD